MDPFTIALATFGVQKLRGKSTKRAFRDAALLGMGSYGIGQMGGFGMGIGQGPAFSSLGLGAGAAGATEAATLGPTATQLPQLSTEAIAGAQFRSPAAQKAMGFNPFGFDPGAAKAGTTKGLGSLWTKFKDSSTGTKIALSAALLPLLEGGEEEAKPPFSEADYEKAYKEQSGKLEGAFVPAENTMPAMSDVWGSNMFYATQGGLAEVVKKFNTGGISYLPSKTDHDEGDYNNYVKAEGYVEDGTGTGNKDKDTMLAQLADGEFVSRADAVLGAGILSGANPDDIKKMREHGAGFFYDQQKKFKRIYDLTHASKTN